MVFGPLDFGQVLQSMPISVLVAKRKVSVLVFCFFLINFSHPSAQASIPNKQSAINIIFVTNSQVG